MSIDRRSCVRGLVIVLAVALSLASDAGAVSAATKLGDCNGRPGSGAVRQRAVDEIGFDQRTSRIELTDLIGQGVHDMEIVVEIKAKPFGNTERAADL